MGRSATTGSFGPVVLASGGAPARLPERGRGGWARSALPWIRSGVARSGGCAARFWGDTGRRSTSGDPGAGLTGARRGVLSEGAARDSAGCCSGGGLTGAICALLGGDAPNSVVATVSVAAFGCCALRRASSVRRAAWYHKAAETPSATTNRAYLENRSTAVVCAEALSVGLREASGRPALGVRSSQMGKSASNAWRAVGKRLLRSRCVARSNQASNPDGTGPSSDGTGRFDSFTTENEISKKFLPTNGLRPVKHSQAMTARAHRSAW